MLSSTETLELQDELRDLLLEVQKLEKKIRRLWLGIGKEEEYGY